MAVAFPLSPAPSGYATVTGSVRANCYYLNETPTFTLSVSGATGYTVRDYTGTIVSSGTVSGTTVSPAAPSGGWQLGWYRLYLTGSATDALFGQSLGATNFCFVANDARFSTRPLRADPASAGGEAADLPTKGWLGIGTSRISIGNAASLTTGSDTLAGAQSNVAQSNAAWSTGAGMTGPDSARPRLSFVNFPNDSTDRVATSNVIYMCKDGTIDGAAVTVTVVAGSSSGVKVTITAGTTEIYDNLGTVAAVIAALGASAYVRAFVQNDQSTTAVPGQIAATAIGNANFQGIKTVVQTLYPLGVQWYEGPINEPDVRKNPPRYVHDAKLFQAAVKAGNASAKAMGPTTVTIGTAATGLSALTAWLAAGGGAYIDGLAVHVYNFCQGDIAIGRQQLANLVSVLTSYGVQNLPRWQTEQGVMTPVYGVHHPRRARWQMLWHLLLEQYGFDRERNNLWYDISHGFWAIPDWWQNADQSVQPHAPMLRTMAAETYGKTFSSTLTFGVADRVLLGSRYTGSDGSSVLAVQLTSEIPGASCTFTVTGAATLTAVDCWGNTSTVPVAAGQATVPISGTPTWVRLPSGVTATPFSALGITTAQPSIRGQRAHIGADPTFLPVDQATYGDYLGLLTGVANGTAPGTVDIYLPRGTRVDHVLLVCGMAWQAHSALLDFDVQTSSDNGQTWTTRATVTRTATSFVHGTNSTNVGCQRETFWDEQWVHNVTFAPVTADAIRLNVRTTSYGGEPDAACVTAGGQGSSSQGIVINEVFALCDEAAQPQFVTA